MPIGGRPLLDYWVECLVRGRDHGGADQHPCPRRAGPGRTSSSVNADGRLRLAESYEPELLGSAGTVAANADLADGADDIVIIYADNLSDIDLRPLLAFHRRHGDPLTMVLFRAPNPRACGIAELDGEGRIVSFVEKPERPPSDLANAGLYVVTMPPLTAKSPRWERSTWASMCFPEFVGRMRGWVWGGYYLDIGTHEALERARREVASIFPDQAGTGAASHATGDLPRSRRHPDRARSLSLPTRRWSGSCPGPPRP